MIKIQHFYDNSQKSSINTSKNIYEIKSFLLKKCKDRNVEIQDPDKFELKIKPCDEFDFLVDTKIKNIYYLEAYYDGVWIDLLYLINKINIDYENIDLEYDFSLFIKNLDYYNEISKKLKILYEKDKIQDKTKIVENHLITEEYNKIISDFKKINAQKFEDSLFVNISNIMD